MASSSTVINIATIRSPSDQRRKKKSPLVMWDTPQRIFSRIEVDILLSIREDREHVMNHQINRLMWRDPEIPGACVRPIGNSSSSHDSCDIELPFAGSGPRVGIVNDPTSAASDKWLVDGLNQKVTERTQRYKTIRTHLMRFVLKMKKKKKEVTPLPSSAVFDLSSNDCSNSDRTSESKKIKRRQKRERQKTIRAKLASALGKILPRKNHEIAQSRKEKNMEQGLQEFLGYSSKYSEQLHNAQIYRQGTLSTETSLEDEKVDDFDDTVDRISDPYDRDGLVVRKITLSFVV